MPEGHLLHHIARRHRTELLGRAVSASSPQGRFADGAAAIDGRTLDEVEAYGKRLFHRFGDDVLHVHLGRLGSFVWSPAPAGPARPQARLRLATEIGAADLFAPIVCEVGPRSLRDEVVSRLGPDPLRDDADPQVVRRAFASDARAVGAVLLDQSVLSGVGNVLRSEALFLVGIDPSTPGSDLDGAAFEELWSTLVAMMRRAADLGRIVTTSEDLVPEAEARFVYKQERCRRCGAEVERPVVGGRVMYRCPLEQARRPLTGRRRA
jgi:endonuclease-8